MDLELKNLDAFFGGSDSYYNVMGVLVTDGVKYCMENGYSWFITDSIIAIRHVEEIRRYLAEDYFLTIELKLKNGTAKMIISDGNGKVLYTQNYTFTDAKRELKLYYVNNVLMLDIEY